MIVPNTKKRLIELLKVLCEQSDAQHFFTTPGLIASMNEQGLSMDRKTLTEDIKFLNEMGFDIVTVKSSPNKYYWKDRHFEEAELCLLIDAVSSSRFIGARKADILRQKLIFMSSMYQQKKLHRHIRHTGKGVAAAKDLYKMVDSITSSTTETKKEIQRDS